MQDLVPLTVLQEAMVFESLGSPFLYNLSLSYPLLAWEPSRRPFLVRSLTKVVRSHAALRSRLVFTAEKHWLQLADESVLEALCDKAVVELSESSSPTRASRFNMQPEDNDIELLWKIVIDPHRIHFLCHHTVVDGSSLKLVDVLIRSALATCKMISGHVDGNTTSADCAIDMSLHNFMRTENERIVAHQDSIDKFWIPQHVSTTMVRLPAGQRIPTDDTVHRYVLPMGLNDLQSLVTPTITSFSSFLTMLWLVLEKFSHEQEFPIGVAMMGRPRQDALSTTIGQFANMMPLVLGSSMGSNISETPLHDMCQSVRRAIVDAKAHEMAPAVSVLRSVRANSGIESLYNVSVTALPDFGDAVLELESTEAITILVQPSRLTVQFDTTIVDETSAKSVADTLMHVMKQVVSTGLSITPGQLCWVPPNQLQQMLSLSRPRFDATFNGHTLHGQWEKMAALYPDNVALADDNNRSMTYSELLAATSMVATTIMDTIKAMAQAQSQLFLGSIHNEDNGAAPVFIPIILEKSIESVIAILAVLRCGFAYVCVDHALPQNRIEYILDESAAQLIIWSSETVRDRCAVLSSSMKCTSFVVDSTLVESPPTTSTFTSECVSLARRVCYMKFTSGTTGRPKGVVIRHEGVVAMIFATQPDVDVTPNDRVLLFSSLSFDASVWHMYAPLLLGATLVVPSSDIIGTIQRQRVTVLDIVPSMVAEMDPADFPSLRVIQLGAEVFPLPMAEKWTSHRPGELVVLNSYGPTEATVISHACVVEENPHVVPIGRPIPNYTSYILGDDLCLLPYGAIGTIWIGGVGLAVGYHNREELTQERFKMIEVEVNKPTERLYNSGDLGRWLPDGTVEYFSRSDDQVKIRGFRVELAEIEQQILQVSEGAIKHCCVLLDKTTEPRLVAFVAPDSIDLPEILNKLRQRVPNYMVPSQTTPIAVMPQNNSGKFDRAALRKMISTLQATPTDVPVAKTTISAGAADTVSLLGGLWAEVLSIPASEVVDPSTSFFQLGGTSLTLVRLVERIKKTWSDLKVSVVNLFQHTSLGEQVAFIDQQLNSSNSAAAPHKKKRKATKREESPVAIVGMAGIFPKAPSVEEFWNLVHEGKSGFHRLSEEELDALGVPLDVRRDSRYVPIVGLLEDTEVFDHKFFALTKEEANVMDPQSRMLLQVVHQALDDAGILREQQHENDENTTIGVFVAGGESTYKEQLVASGANRDPRTAYAVDLGNSIGSLATRVAYHFDLNGPAVTANTNCSSGLTVLQLAMDAIRCGRCDTAVVAATSISFPQAGYLHQVGMIMSESGVCAPFSADADGTVVGNSVSAVVLRRQDVALSSGNALYSILRSVATNNDGRRKMGFTTPSVSGQKGAITRALDDADLQEGELQLIEAHGTGTKVGDPIEAQSIRESVADADAATVPQSVAVTSAKAFVGHTDVAAGLTGLVKAVMSLMHGCAPAQPHITESGLNPLLEFETSSSPFFVPRNGTQHDFVSNQCGSVAAAVNSFGMGGTNASCVVSRPQQPDDTTVPQSTKSLLLLSAHSKEALQALAEGTVATVKNLPPNALVSTLARIATTRLQHPDWRVAVKVIQNERHIDCELIQPHNGAESEVTVLFPGQGSWKRDEMETLYNNISSFKAGVDEAFTFVTNASARKQLFDKTQPVTKWYQLYAFVSSFAMATVMLEMMSPKTTVNMIGHSLGEYAMMAATKMISLRCAVALVEARIDIIEKYHPSGSMAATKMGYDDATKFVKTFNARHDDAELSLAGSNAPDQTVISGSEESINIAAAQLEVMGVKAKIIPTTAAYHSHLITPTALDEWRCKVQSVMKKAKGKHLPRANVNCISTVEGYQGDMITADRITANDCQYFVSHMRHAVRFKEAVTQSWSLLCGSVSGNAVFVEAGHGNTLSNLVKQCSCDDHVALSCIPTTVNGMPSPDTFLAMVGKMWNHGLLEVTRETFVKSAVVGHSGSPDFNVHHCALPPYPVSAAIKGEVILSGEGTCGDNASFISNDSFTNRNAIQQESIESKNSVRTIRGIIAEILGLKRREVSDDSNFFDIGGDSFSATSVLSRISFVFKISAKLDITLLFKCPTPLELWYQLNLIANGGKTLGFSQLKAAEAGAPQHVVYCIPPAGGSLLVYLHMCEELSWASHTEIVGLPFPAQFDGLPASVEDIAHAMIDQLVQHAHFADGSDSGEDQVPKHRSIHLVGMSFGGMVAFEMMRQMQQKENARGIVATIRSCNMIDTPTKSCFKPGTSNTDFYSIFVDMFGEKHGIEYPENPPSTQSEAELLAVSVARQLGIARTNDELTELRTSVKRFQENVISLLNYQLPSSTAVQNRFGFTNFNFFQALNPRDVDPVDPFLAWSETGTACYAQTSFIPVRGHHLSMMRPPNVQTVARTLMKELPWGAADGTHPSSQKIRLQHRFETCLIDADHDKLGYCAVDVPARLIDLPKSSLVVANSSKLSATSEQTTEREIVCEGDVCFMRPSKKQ